ncbi:hypothetical protein BV25DRAFT_333872 [Artomyces pyxidatus]|uniref:Uncharacterized protein n=1 Tax=Artomyces pyxidatus TaxID=48021 RepID=A0ACB8T7B3_9AGAM|nr:hypothetical protein BV25DRAFT_333872 [Artomyces pyxidatus]
MPFNFTFNISVPGITNPFSARPETRTSDAPAAPVKDPNVARLRRPHPSSLPPSLPLSRKRGWVPTESEISHAATSTASSSGYLDTPAKYRDFTINPEPREEDEVEEMVADLPPAKRRRTLAGSIVSTAVSAALIGTAVGLTVYRLWRDRGREPELVPPPPPYEQGDWVHSDSAEDSPPVLVTPLTPLNNKKSRNAPASIRRAAPRHRRTRTRAMIVPVSPPRKTSPERPVQSHFDFNGMDEAEEVEDKMDWIGDKLAKLIEDGKKALGKEVVVLSETQEDEIDDGSGNWEEEAGPSAGTSSRRGSIRRRGRPHALGLPASFSSPQFASPPMSASPRRGQFGAQPHSSPGYGSVALPIPGRMEREASVDSSVRSYGSFHEDESQWQSSELRESMERARANYLRNRS